MKTVLDQIEFMEEKLRLKELATGITYYISRVERVFGKEEDNGRRLLVAALYEGEIHRGQVTTITCKRDTAARKILQKALEANLLESDTPKGTVRLAFPAKVLNYYFPNLYSDSDS